MTEQCIAFEKEYGHLVKNVSSIVDSKNEILAADVLYLPGGHACYADYHDEMLADIINKFYADGKVIAADCHGPVALCNYALKKPGKQFYLYYFVLLNLPKYTIRWLISSSWS